MNKIRKSIIVLLIMLIILIVFIFILFRAKKNKENLNNYLENGINNTSQNSEANSNYIVEEPLEYNDDWETQKTDFAYENDTYVYFFLKQCMDTYYSSIENAYKLIDEEALNKLNINKSNFSSIYGLITKPSYCIDEIIEEQLNAKRKLYCVTYRIETSDHSNKKQIIFIKYDMENFTFSVYPSQFFDSNQINNIKDGTYLEVSGISDIVETEVNRYHPDFISADAPAIMSELLKRLQFDIKFDLNHLYNSLDEKYRELKFENDPNKFLKYVNENKDIILNDEITGYQLHNTDEYTQYYGLASSQNHYIFNTNISNNLMDYTIMLDNYIVDVPQAQEAYEKGSAKAKAEYCLKKTINAINDGNYNIIYDKLSLTQKNQYSSYDEFTKYLKRAFYEKNDYEIEDYIILNKDSAYQFLIKITDSTKKEFSFRRYNIRIVLQDDMDYIVNITQYKN